MLRLRAPAARLLLLLVAVACCAHAAHARDLLTTCPSDQTRVTVSVERVERGSNVRCSDALAASLDFKLSTNTGTNLKIPASLTAGGVTCTTAEPDVNAVPSGRTVTYVCARPVPAGWPLGVVSFELTATGIQKPGESALCAGTGKGANSLTITELPTVEVSRPTASVCAASRASAELSFTVASTPAGPINVPATLTSAGVTCTTTQTSPVVSGTAVKYECGPPAGGWVAGSTFSFELRAGVKSCDECAGSGACACQCAASATGVGVLSVVSGPSVDVEALGSPKVCRESGGGVSLSFRASSAPASGAIAVPATLTDASGALSCMTATTSVASGATVTYACAKPSGGWRAASYAVALTATTTGGSGCGGSGKATATITTTDKPVVTVGAPRPLDICATDATATLSFAVKSAGAPAGITVESGAVACSAAPSSGVSDATVAVTCQRGAGWPATGKFTVTLVAVADDGLGCAATTRAPVDVSIAGPDAVTVEGPAAPTVCAKPATTTLTYVVKGADAAVSASSATAGVVCSTTATTVASGGRVPVTCTAASGELPATFSVRVTATPPAGRCGAGEPASVTTPVSAICCASGKASVRGDNAACFTSLFRPGLPALPPKDALAVLKAEALTPPVSASGCDHPGFLNRFSRATPDRAAYDVVYNANADCSGGVVVGSLAASCAAAGAGGATVTLGPAEQAAIGGVSAAFFVGCRPIDTCVAPDFGAAASACDGGSATTSCGGVLSELASAPQTFSLGCACDQVYWVVREHAAGFAVPRTAAGACPLLPPPSGFCSKKEDSLFPGLPTLPSMPSLPAVKEEESGALAALKSEVAANGGGRNGAAQGGGLKGKVIKVFGH